MRLRIQDEITPFEADKLLQMAGRKLSGAVILTGGRDGMGRPLITFVGGVSVRQHGGAMEEDVLMAETTHLLRLLPHSTTGGAAFLANFRTDSREHMVAVVNVLEKLQLQNRGVVGVLYAVLPKSRDLQKTLKKQLGVKASRKAPKVQAYECVLVNEVKELHKSLDASQLTAEFEGKMPYDHTAWTKFTQHHEELMEKIEKVSRRVPAGLDKLGMMLEYDIPTDPAEAEQLLASVRQKYNNVMREINVEHTIDACKAYIESLRSPGGESLQALPATMLLPALHSIESKMEALIKQRQQLKQCWQQAEARIQMKTKVQKYKAKAEKILQWIKDIGMPGVNDDPDIADSLSKAEILKTHFETGFYANAKNVVWLSRKIQKKLEDLVLESKKNIPDLLKFSRNFQATTEYFKKAVDKKYQVYVNVHSFYLTAQKMTSWYQRTLHFIPIQLLCERTMYDGRGREVKVIQPTNAWRAAVDDFIHRHPMPKVSQLSKLDKVLPVIDNLIVRNQARLLIHRIKIICKLLANIDGTPTGVVAEVMRWRSQVESGADDITLNKHSTSLFDPTSLPRFECQFPSVSLGSMSRMSHASSTKSLSGQGQKFVLHEIAYDDNADHTDGAFHTMGRRARSPAKKTAHFQDQSILRNKSDATVRKAPRERSLPRAATLDRSSKLRSQSEHNLNYIPDDAPQHMPAKLTRFDTPVVPPLDLSFIAPKKKLPSKSRTRKVDDDFGIYGDSDDSEIAMPMPKERYISLDIPHNGHNVAQTLKHVSIRTPDEIHRIQRPDSVTDSGITHTQTGTDASALSLNTLGLSPIAIDTVADSQANPAHTPPQNTPNPALFSKSLPDLNYQPNGSLDLTQSNIEAICKSPLSEEEKMNLMAALCEDLDSNSRPPSRANAMLHRLSNNTTPAEANPLKPDTKAAQRKPPNRNHTPIQSTQESSNPLHKKESVPMCEESGRPSSDLKSPPDAPMDSVSISSPDAQRKKKQEYGIDVAAWVNRYGYDADSLEAESTGISPVEVNSNDGLEEYVEKLKTHHIERKEDEVEWQKERSRMKDIQLEEEALCQDNVEQSLKRTHRLLQEQELLLRGSTAAAGTGPGRKQPAPRTAMQEQQVPRADIGAAGGDNFDDCSASEESGIFTQTSNDSRFRFSESGSELHLRMMLPNDVNRSKPKPTAPAVPVNNAPQAHHKPKQTAPAAPVNNAANHKPKQNALAVPVNNAPQAHHKPKQSAPAVPVNNAAHHKSESKPSTQQYTSNTQPDVRPKTRMDTRDNSKQTDSKTSHVDTKQKEVGGVDSPVAGTPTKRQAPKPAPRLSRLQKPQTVFESETSTKDSDIKSASSESNGKCMTGMLDNPVLDATASSFGGGTLCSEDGSIKVTGLDSESELIHDDDPKNNTLTKLTKSLQGETSEATVLSQYQSTDALNIIGKDNLSTRSFTEDDYTDETNSIDCELSIPHNALRQLERQQSRTPEKRITIHQAANKDREESKTPEIEFLSEGEMNYESDESAENESVQKPEKTAVQNSYSDVLQAIDRLKGADPKNAVSVTNCSQESLNSSEQVVRSSYLAHRSPIVTDSMQDESKDGKNPQIPNHLHSQKTQSEYVDDIHVGREAGDETMMKEIQQAERQNSLSGVHGIKAQIPRNERHLLGNDVEDSLASESERGENALGGDLCIDVRKYQLGKNRGDDIAQRQIPTQNIAIAHNNEGSQSTNIEITSPESKKATSSMQFDSKTSQPKGKRQSLYEASPEQYQERAVDVPTLPIPHSDKHKRFSTQVSASQEPKKVKKEKKGIFSFFKRKNKKKAKRDSIVSEDSSLQSFEASSVASANPGPTSNNEKSRDKRDKQVYKAVPYQESLARNTQDVSGKPPRQPSLQNPTATTDASRSNAERMRAKKCAPVPPEEDSLMDSVSSTNVAVKHQKQNHLQETHDQMDQMSHVFKKEQQSKHCETKNQDIDEEENKVLLEDKKHSTQYELPHDSRRTLETNGGQTVDEEICSDDDRHSLEDIESIESDSLPDEILVVDGEEDCKDDKTRISSYQDIGSEIPFATCYTTEMLNLKTPVIIDNGSGVCKCGLASDENPTAVFPNVVGRPKYQEAIAGEYKDVYVGQSAQRYRGMLQMAYPLDHGLVTNWQDMELLWEHALENELRLDSSEHPVLLTEPPLNPLKHRERMAEVMFETFAVPAFYVSIQAVLALYGSGRTTGVVLDIGDGVTHVVPVYEGYSLPHATRRVNLAGRELTHYLTTLLKEGGISLTTSAEAEIARDIKEQHCYVAENFYEESLKASTGSKLEELYYMPDGNAITLNSERFRCPEVLFQPSFIGMEDSGIHYCVQNSINKCDIDIRKQLLQNVILSGGTTMLPGLPGRMEKELLQLFPNVPPTSVNVRCADDRQYLVWKGGAALASMPNFTSSWFFRQEYEEFGTNLVHKKCF